MRRVMALVGSRPNGYTLIYFDWHTPKKRGEFLRVMEALRRQGGLPDRTFSVSSTTSGGMVFLAIPPEGVSRDAVQAVSTACALSMGMRVFECEMPDAAYRMGMAAVREALRDPNNRPDYLS